MTSKITVRIDASTPQGLRKLRQALGITLDEVAQKTGYKVTWLSRAERGFRPMTDDDIATIRAALDELAQEKAA